MLVTTANAIINGAGGPIQWVHMPVPIARDDAAYFQPLTDLQVPAETELFLGLLHDADGVEGSERRIAAAQRFQPTFGVATECGMGRVPTAAISGLLRLHRETAEVIA